MIGNADLKFIHIQFHTRTWVEPARLAIMSDIRTRAHGQSRGETLINLVAIGVDSSAGSASNPFVRRLIGE